MTEPVWLTRPMVEAMHAEQVREHGGQLGTRDPGLLDSAMARPRNSWAYKPNIDLAALAAEYAFGLAKNHPFVDGNKRVAFVATNVFLLLNGYEIEAAEPEVIEAMLRLAEGRMSRPKFAKWIRDHLVKHDE